MKFLLLLDDTYSNQQFIDHVKGRLSKLENAELCVCILHDSKFVDSDTQILLTILMKEKQRCPIIVDPKVAKFYPEILKLQESVVLFNHETMIARDSDEYSLFTEALAAAHGARIDYIDKNFHDIENDKHLTVVDIASHYVSDDYFIHMSKIYNLEHKRYPTLLLPRCVINDATSEEELVSFYENRNEYVMQAGLVTSKHSDRNYDNPIQFDDIMIHSFGLMKHIIASKPLFNKKV